LCLVAEVGVEAGPTFWGGKKFGSGRIGQARENAVIFGSHSDPGPRREERPGAWISATGVGGIIILSDAEPNFFQDSN